MMGRQPNQQQKMFYDRINLDQRIRSDHVLRQIAQHLDFDFIYNEVQETYGANGNVSVPPPVILKMMLLLILVCQAKPGQSCELRGVHLVNCPFNK